MSDLQIFDFESNDVRTVLIDGEPWFVSKDVCNILEIKNSRDALSSLDEEDKASVGIPDTSSSTRKSITMTVVNESGIKRLVSKSRKPQARELAKQLGLECYFSPIEADCLRIIQSAFQHLKPIQQFQISDYKIDIYFPEHKIAVECDENDHSAYNKREEIIRQNQITKLLGCQFIRFNPNEKGFNIGKVINNIFLAVYQ